MNKAEQQLLTCYFEELDNAQNRAIELYSNEKYHLEGVTILMCHIAAISSARYPNHRDWKAFKELVKNYSSLYNTYENIDLLFFYQWQDSIYSSDKEYNKLEKYEEILQVFVENYGDEENVKDSDNRYQKRENLLKTLTAAGISDFDEDNFTKFIELFSNNQIFYSYARCEAVHNNDFPLINIGYTFPDMQRVYTHNHQITGDVIVETLTNIIANLEKECLSKEKWPQELENM